MPLVNAEQLDEEHHRVIFSQPMFIAPLGDGLVELLVEVGLFVVGHGITSWAVASQRQIQSRR